jgi:ABC-type siderophore export system fused ATPase/permease subunit
MTLVIQIALGIVLAFLILTFLRQLFAIGVGLLALCGIGLGAVWLWANADTAVQVGIAFLGMGGVILGAIGIILAAQAAFRKLRQWKREYQQKHAKPFQRIVSPQMKETRARMGYDD